MPGMMDTILNIGLNDAHRRGPRSKQTGNERFAWDSYRRFVQMYGDVVLDLKPQSKTETTRSRTSLQKQEARARRRSSTPSSTADDLQGAGRSEFKEVIKSASGKDFPDDPDGAGLGRDRRRVRLAG